MILLYQEEAKPNTAKVSDDEVIKEEVIDTNNGKDEQEVDWAQMFQMGMALGKSILGEEAVEKIKKGDLSELIKVGEKVLGENTVKDFLNSATEGAFASKEGGHEGKDTSEDGDILEDDEDSLEDIVTSSEPDENVDTLTETVEAVKESEVLISKF